jgi:hypothetical protein
MCRLVDFSVGVFGLMLVTRVCASSPKVFSARAKSYGYFEGEPEYNSVTDINKDGVVDISDLSFAGWNLGWNWATDL